MEESREPTPAQVLLPKAAWTTARGLLLTGYIAILFISTTAWAILIAAKQVDAAGQVFPYIYCALHLVLLVSGFILLGHCSDTTTLPRASEKVVLGVWLYSALSSFAALMSATLHYGWSYMLQITILFAVLPVTSFVCCFYGTPFFAAMEHRMRHFRRKRSHLANAAEEATATIMQGSLGGSNCELGDTSEFRFPFARI